MRTRRLLTTLAVTVLTVTSACAPLPAEQEPRAISRDKVPELFPTTTLPELRTGTLASVCFVPQRRDDESASSAPHADTADDRDLNCVDTKVPERTPGRLIDALATGPDEEQRSLGLTSSVPQNTHLVTPPLRDGGVLEINLSAEINDVSSPNNTVAYHQIVETLTRPDNGLDVDRIRVRIDGVPTKIPTADEAKYVVTVDDFHRETISSGTTTSHPR